MLKLRRKVGIIHLAIAVRMPQRGAVRPLSVAAHAELLHHEGGGGREEGHVGVGHQDHGHGHHLDGNGNGHGGGYER